MPLTLAKQGENCRVIKVTADEKTKRHLENLGIMQGTVIVPLTAAEGNVIIKVKDGRVALNAAQAGKILVA